MTPTRKKLLGLMIVLLLLVAPGISVWKTYQQDKQDRLNQALMDAIKRNDARAVVRLLEAHADANARDVPPDTRSGWQRLWDTLRGRRNSVQPAQSALLLAVQGFPGTGSSKENLPIIKALLDKGADVNSRNEVGMTALMSAAVDQHIRTVALLLDKGADVALKDHGDDLVITNRGMTYKVHQGGRTAIQYADEFSEWPDIQTTQLLLQHGADVEDRNDSGETLLTHAAASGIVGKVRFLLDHGADVNATDKYHRTALMLAANSAYTDMIALLKKRGADVNARDNEGETALMYSMEGPGDNPRTLRQLLKMGADASVKSNAGKTARSIAEKQNYAESIRLFNEAGVRK